MCSVFKTKKYILNSLISLLEKNIVRSGAFKNRFDGFNAELDFSSWYRKQRRSELFSGGFFVPTRKNAASFDNSIYVTTSKSSPDDFIGVYERLSPLAKVGLYFIQYDVHTWQEFTFDDELTLAHPSLEVYEFKGGGFKPCCMGDLLGHFDKRSSAGKVSVDSNLKKQYVEKFYQYEFEDIVELYVSRVLLDGYIGFRENRGVPLDIDAIAIDRESKNYVILEVKEKDKSKTGTKGFGMDTRRIDSLRKLQHVSGFKTFYIVRHVRDQTTRDFLEWVYISLDEFYSAIEKETIKPGGYGMLYAKGGRPATKVCDYNLFKKLR